MAYIKTDKPGMIRDTHSKAILFTDNQARQEYLDRMSEKQKIQNEINTNDKNFINEFKQWKILATEVMKLSTEGEENFFRKYAETNVYEMFAVCVECFFERTEEFKTNLPELFDCMKRILKQNPLAVSNPILA